LSASFICHACKTEEKKSDDKWCEERRRQRQRGDVEEVEARIDVAEGPGKRYGKAGSGCSAKRYLHERLFGGAGLLLQRVHAQGHGGGVAIQLAEAVGGRAVSEGEA